MLIQGEKCSKCCFDLKDKESNIHCKNLCIKKQKCENYIISCYTKEYLEQK